MAEQPEEFREAVAFALRAHHIECTGPGEVTCSCREGGWMSLSDYIEHQAAVVVEAADDGTLVFECADCGDRWDEDDLVQVQPDGRLACPSPCHEDDGGGTTFTMLRDLGPISTWPNVFGRSEVDRG